MGRRSPESISKLPTSAPMTPTNRFVRRPCSRPVICSAIQPATMPTKIQAKMLMAGLSLKVDVRRCFGNGAVALAVPRAGVIRDRKLRDASPLAFMTLTRQVNLALAR